MGAQKLSAPIFSSSCPHFFQENDHFFCINNPPFVFLMFLLFSKQVPPIFLGKIFFFNLFQEFSIFLIEFQPEMAIFDNIFVTRKLRFIISKTYGYSSKKKERLSSSMPFHMETPEYCNAVDKPNDHKLFEHQLLHFRNESTTERQP